jgi:hypothetical protein
MSQHHEEEVSMQSTSRRSAARPRRLSALLIGAILALAWTACTRDAESREAAEATPAAAKAIATTAAEPAAAPAPADPAAGAARAVAEPAEAVPQGKTVGGDESYTVTLDAPERLASGAEGTVRVSVVPKKGWKMNKEFPTKLEVQAPAGVEVVKAEQRVADAERFEDAGATWAIKFKATGTGAKSFQAKFKFAVCTDATCDPKKQDLAWVVNVE